LILIDLGTKDFFVNGNLPFAFEWKGNQMDDDFDGFARVEST
jgi:hypothetical protein